MQWQPIATAPKTSDDILIWADCGAYLAAWYERRQQGGHDGWHTYDGYEWHVIQSNPPTHWMPVPAPPAPCDGSGEAGETEGLDTKCDSAVDVASSEVEAPIHTPTPQETARVED